MNEREAEMAAIFESLMSIYEGWVMNPGNDDSGAIAISNAVFFIFPEYRDEAKKRAAAIRATQEAEPSRYPWTKVRWSPEEGIVSERVYPSGATPKADPTPALDRP